MKTLLLPSTGRKWREKNTLGVSGKWQVEVGEPTSPLLGVLESELIKESSSNVRKGLQAPLHLKLLSLVLAEVVSRPQITHSPKSQPHVPSTLLQIIPKVQGWVERRHSLGYFGVFNRSVVSLSRETILLCWPTAIVASEKVA